jgi:hypothetical protein
MNLFQMQPCRRSSAAGESTNHATENLNVMRKAALHLLRKTAYPKNDSASSGKWSGQPSTTISFNSHCSIKLNEVALIVKLPT